MEPRLRATFAAAVLAALSMAGCGGDGGRLYGSGPWERHTVDDSLRGADGVKVADANGDGWPDLAVAWEGSGVARVYLHPGTS